MRNLLFLLLLTSPVISLAQFAFPADSSESVFPFELYRETELRKPDADSLLFELRFWVSGEFGGFLQLTFGQDSTWNYRRGYLRGEHNVRIMQPLAHPPNVDSIWPELSGNSILTLPDQNELIYTYEKDGRTFKLGPEISETERLVHATLDGTGYAIELFSIDRYRSYYYYNAINLDRNFKRAGWRSDETEKFATIATLLIDSFALSEVFKANMREKMNKE